MNDSLNHSLSDATEAGNAVQIYCSVSGLHSYYIEHNVLTVVK